MVKLITSSPYAHVIAQVERNAVADHFRRFDDLLPR